MAGTLLLIVFVGALLCALWAVRAHYRAHFVVGSPVWNARQLALREALARASSDEVERHEVNRDLYHRGLRAQTARGLFADDLERANARALGQRENLYRERERRELERTLEEREGH